MMTAIVVELDNSLDTQFLCSNLKSRIGRQSEQSHSSRTTWSAESLAKLSSLVRFDSPGSVGGPCGTSRSVAERVVHMKMPMDSCSPVDDQPFNLSKSLTDSHQRGPSQGYSEI